MATYCVNKNAQHNGDHEVHRKGCVLWPQPDNRISLGGHATCHGAVREARKHFTKMSGCLYCPNECHTG